MDKRLIRKFSSFLIVSGVLFAGASLAKNKWESRMEKDPPANPTAQTQSSGATNLGNESPVNCMNVLLRVNTDINSDTGGISSVRVNELKNGASVTFPCASFTPPLNGGGQPVIGGNITAACSYGKMSVTASSCVLQPKDCGPQVIAIPAGILSGSPATNLTTGAITTGGTADYACTSAPGLTKDGVAVDRGIIRAKCDNGLASYLTHNCDIPPPCPAGYCQALCGSWCSDGTQSTSWTDTSNTLTHCKSARKAAGKNSTTIVWTCSTYTSTYRTCQNGQVYRTISVSGTQQGTYGGAGWACTGSASSY